MTKEDQTKNVDERGKTTVAQRGPVLPVGIAQGGQLHRDLAVRPWRMKEERALGKLREEGKSGNLAQYVGTVLAYMCTKLGPFNLEEMKITERQLIIGQMYMADVFYAYVWLRIQALGKLFPITFQPAWAVEPLKIECDLETIDVRTIEKLEEAISTYKLGTPITIRGKKVTGFKLGPQRWSSLENIKGIGQTQDFSIPKLAVIKAGIVECEGIPGEIALTDDELDELTKLDLERLTAHMDRHVLGPIMMVEGSHQGRQFRAPIDWGYDSFFAISSG